MGDGTGERKASAPFLVAQMVFAFSSSSSSSLLFPLPHNTPPRPGPKHRRPVPGLIPGVQIQVLPLSRSQSRCINPGVCLFQVPIQVCKSQMLSCVQSPNLGVQIQIFSCSRSQSRCTNPDVVFLQGAIPSLVQIQMLSCARPHSHRCANPGVVLHQAPFTQVCKSRCCLVQGPIPTGVQIQVLSCSWSHSRCANPRASK